MALTLANYRVQIDWDGNGCFGQAGFPYWFPFAFCTGVPIGDALEDISDDVREFSWMRGRDAELDKTETGDASITVVDTAGKYIPQNTASPLYDEIKPGRQVYIRAEHLGVYYHLFRGYLDDVLPEPHLEEQRAVMPCLDGLDKMARDKITMGIQTGKKSGELFTEGLDKVGWHAIRRALDLGVDTYPLVFTERLGCRTFFDKLALSEFGFFYVEGDGYLHWEDRSHRLIPPHTISQWTASADKYIDLEPMTSFKTIRNVIIIDGQPYIPNAAVVELWRLWENKDNAPPDSPMLRPGASYDYWAKFERIAENVVAPVATTDYLGNTQADGAGVNKTAQLTVSATVFAQSAKITVTNTDPGNVYLTLLKIRGEMYDMPEKLEIVEENALSIAEYGERHLVISLPYYSNSQAMRDMATYQLGLTKNPWRRYRITLVGDTDEILTQILARKLSDHIILQNADFNIDDHFFIEKMEHQVGEDKIHRCRWTLTRVEDMILFWIWDESSWDSSTRWGF